MASDWLPGMAMYEATWQRDGTTVGCLCIPALDEADTIRRVEALFAEHPEHDFLGGRDGTTVQIKRLTTNA